jgi:hypothetical protein
LVTKFLVHGFTDSGNAAWIIAMKDAFLRAVSLTIKKKAFLLLLISSMTKM